jgi:hypothetical protein
MGTPPTSPESSKPKLTWYQHVWLALPIFLVFVGGAIGGACGGAAWAINQSVFQKTKDPFLRYLWTGLISVAAFALYFFVAVFFLALFRG